MPRTQYRYELEATRLRAGKCPVCASPLIHHVVLKDFRCADSSCFVRFTEVDFHQEAGWAKIRGMKDTRPVITGSPEPL